MQQQEKKSLKLSKQLLIISFILVVAGAGSWLLLRGQLAQSSKTIELSVLTIKKDAVEDKISGERGILELVGQRQLKSPTEGTVEKVAVKVGDRVKAGQILILLRDPERQTKLREHQYQLQEQQLDLAYKQQEVLQAETDLTKSKQELQRQLSNFRNLQQTETLKKQSEIEKQELNLAQKRLQIEEARSQLAEAQQQLEADERLFARGFIAEDQLQEQKKTVRSDRLNLTNTQLEARQLAIDLEQLRLELKNQTSDTQDKIRQTESAVDDAQIKLRQAKSELSKASIALDKLQLDRRKIEEELQKNTIVAPISAMVLDLPVRAGDVVKFGDNLLTIGDDSQQVVELKISTINAAKVKPNQLVHVSSIGPQAKTFNGKVEQVSLLATMEQEGSSQSQAKVSATVKLEPQSDRLIPGSPVNVDIILERRQDVVAIDTEAVQQGDLEPFVWVLDSQGKAQKRNVTLGLEGLTNVEITSGLRPGDRVLLPPPDTELESGMLVKVK